MSSVDTPTLLQTAQAAPLSPEDLARVENALETIHLKELKSDVPKMFNASGPVSVISLDQSWSLLTIVPDSSSLTNLQP